ncbi:MAG: methionyl-tRNA formyltransferase [Candidatus Aminicenantes bacterium]|nr:methionyl-tRNA formyltransferase [Candidatus Aminicenantes bacterium]
MRLVFFGSPEAALPALERLLGDGHEVAAVVTQPDKPAGRGKLLTPCAVKRFALSRGLAVLQPERIRNDPSIKDRLEDVRPDVHIVVAYGQILPAPILFLPRRRTLNVHFSLLPKYRGAAPVAWSILRGETRTGVTLMELNERMDEGDILAQEETDIRPDETAASLEKRLAVLGAGLLAESLGRIDRLERRPQDSRLATYAPKLRKEDGRLDWAQEAEAVDRRVRAFTPWPSAFTGFRDRRVIVLEGRVNPENTGKSVPGTILSSSGEGLRVACGRDIYVVERLQPENKKPMSAWDFSLGARIRDGERFSG